MIADTVRVVPRTLGRVLLLVPVILACIAPSLTYAEDEIAKTVESVALGGGSSNGGSSDASLPDLFTGAFSYQIPIEVPPGRNGMDPGLALSYNSRNGNGVVAQGWELEVGSIERSSRFGVNYSKDDYLLRRAGSASELVKVGIFPDFRSKIESDFLNIRQVKVTNTFPGRYFVATNKQGILFYFGQTENSCVYGPQGIFKWALSSIQDPYGNTITFTYSRDNGQIYLDHIDYNGNQVKFYLEDRPDAPEMHNTGFLIKTAKRLKTIEILGADGSRVGAYKLTYLQGRNTNRSLLNEVTRFGKDADVGTDSSGTTGVILNEPTAMKIKLFKSPDYGDIDDNSFNSTSEPGGIDGAGWSEGNTLQLVGDFNGDGKADILKLQTDGNNQLLLSNGDNTFTSLVPMDSNGTPYSGWYSVKPAVLAGDFNGDGKTDLLIMKSDGTNNLYHYNSDGKFDCQSSPLGSSATWQEPAFKLTGDFDGDGKADVLIWQSTGVAKLFLSSKGYSSTSITLVAWAYDTTRVVTGVFTNNGKTSILFLRSDGDNWLALLDGNGNFIWISLLGDLNAIGGWTSPTIQYAAGDFNGDGVVDILRMDRNSSIAELYESKGDGTFVKKLAPGLGGSDCTYCGSLRQFVGDFNGDGKADVLKVSYNLVETCIDLPGYICIPDFVYYTSTIYTSNGDGTFNATNYGNGNNSKLKFVADGKNDLRMNILVGDFLGNGKTSIVGWTPLGGPNNVLYTKVNDRPLDILRSFYNGSGGLVSIDYTVSTKLADTQIPFPIWVVTSVTTNDGNGNSSQTTFDYSNGYYYAPERDFRGFNHVTVKGPVGANGQQKITEIWFHQGNDVSVGANDPNVATGYMKGKPYRVRITDGSGNTYSEIETTYANRDRSGNPVPWYFNPPAQVDTYICDGNVIGRCSGTSSARHYQTAYVYDIGYPGVPEYGNVSYEYHHGDADDPTKDDKFTIYRTYSPNDANWIVGLQTSETVYQGLDTTTPVASTSYYYDGVTDCTTASTNQTPDKGKLTRIKRSLKYDTTDTTIEERFAYDSYGNQVCRRDANGNITTIGYDSGNTFPVSVTSPPTTNIPAGLTTTTAYYGVNGVPTDKGLYGQVKSATDPNNATTAYEYDPLGRKVLESRPDTTSTAWAYENFGTVGSQHVRVSDSNGLWKESYFDGLRRTYLEKSKAPESKIVANDTIYDARGMVRKSSLPYFYAQETPRYIVTDYDPLGRVIRTGQESPADYIRSLTCYYYDVTVKIDPNNHRRREVRDAYGRLVKVQEYTGTYATCTTDEGTPYAATRYQYDVLGNLRYVTDHKQNQTEMRYDTLGRKRWMSDPDMGIWRYDYDGNGNLRFQTDAKQQVIEYRYDALNRPVRKYHGDTLVLTNSYDEATSGNAKGRLSHMEDATGQIEFGYDNIGRTTSATRTIFDSTYTFGYSYVNGLLVSITYPDNDIVRYTYDSGALKGVTGYIAYSNFDALGRPLNVAYGSGGASSLFSYDNVTKRLSTLSVASPTQGLLIDNSYGYDNKGNITSITDRLDKPLQTDLSSETYTPVRAHAVGFTGSGRVFQYDDNGNMCNDNGTNCSSKFIYNYDNMPTAIGSVGFTYDGTGKRVRKSSSSGTTVYIDNLYECTDGVCGKYIFAGNSRVASNKGGLILYYHPDHQGSTAVVTNALGESEENIAYYPFGGTRQDADTGAGINLKHKYTGQELDSETGLYNYNARLYDPDLGRFLTPDTVVPNPADPQSLNRYAYARNNPILYNDPTGHWFGIDDLVATVVGAIVGGVTAAIEGHDIGQGIGIGAASAWIGYNTFGASYAAVEGMTGSSVAGGFVGGAAGGAAGGATAGGLYAASNGQNIGEGMLSGAQSGAIAGGITGGLISLGVPNAFAAFAGGYAAGGEKGGWYSALSVGVGNLITMATPYGTDEVVPEKGTPEYERFSSQNRSYVAKPAYNDWSDVFWNLIALTGNGYSHAGHTQDTYAMSGRSIMYMDDNVAFPGEAYRQPGKYNLFTNNCTTRFGMGYWNPGQYAATTLTPFLNYNYRRR